MVKVLHPGFYCSIQDFGRNGFAHFGVSMAGVMDEQAANWANYLLQNAANSALLEITFGGCKLQFLASTCICITGADFSATLDGETILLNKPIAVKENSILAFGKRKFGLRSYIAVVGGFNTHVVLKSRSFFKGITNKTIIQKGDMLPFKSFIYSPSITNTSIKIDTAYFNQQTIFCTKGPEFDLLSQQQIDALSSNKFSISTNNNRMGYQLNELVENTFSSMLTSAVLPGTVQLTPGGKLIILMRDCQVTGGYPRVLQLNQTSINVLAQKTTGDSFQFTIE